MSQISHVIIGGDGAAWIEERLGWFPGAVRQRDGVHLRPGEQARKALAWASSLDRVACIQTVGPAVPLSRS